MSGWVSVSGHCMLFDNGLHVKQKRHKKQNADIGGERGGLLKIEMRAGEEGRIRVSRTIRMRWGFIGWPTP